MPVNQSGRQIQCYECQQFGHKRAECPNKNGERNGFCPPLPPQRRVFQSRPRNQPKPNASNLSKEATVNYVRVEEEAEERAQIYAALDPSGRNRQFSILEVQGDYEGKSLTFLIDFGSSHSFISPSTAKRLGVNPQPIGRMLNSSLANKTSILTDELVVSFSFNLDGNPTAQNFRILKIGKFQGILGMDWLGQNQAGIYCN